MLAGQTQINGSVWEVQTLLRLYEEMQCNFDVAYVTSAFLLAVQKQTKKGSERCADLRGAPQGGSSSEQVPRSVWSESTFNQFD